MRTTRRAASGVSRVAGGKVSPSSRTAGPVPTATCCSPMNAAFSIRSSSPGFRGWATDLPHRRKTGCSPGAGRCRGRAPSCRPARRCGGERAARGTRKTRFAPRSRDRCTGCPLPAGDAVRSREPGVRDRPVVRATTHGDRRGLSARVRPGAKSVRSAGAGHPPEVGSARSKPGRRRRELPAMRPRIQHRSASGLIETRDHPAPPRPSPARPGRRRYRLSPGGHAPPGRPRAAIRASGDRRCLHYNRRTGLVGPPVAPARRASAPASRGRRRGRAGCVFRRGPPLDRPSTSTLPRPESGIPAPHRRRDHRAALPQAFEARPEPTPCR